MPSASDRVRASGFSTSTVLPSSSACMTGLTCSPSLVATITAFTSGREIAARLSPELNCAPILCARSRARAGSASEIAMKLTAGCPAASRARKLPMRPAPTTAIPSCLRSIMSLLGFDPGLAREAPLLLEFGPDVPGELLGAGNARLVHGRDVGQERRALQARDCERTQLPRPDVRRRGAHLVVHHRDLAADHVDERLRVALV